MATAGGATELEALRREFDDYKAESAALDEELERSLATAQREAEMVGAASAAPSSGKCAPH
jgi:hypothetical protein